MPKLHVIAISKIMNSEKELEVYIYKDGTIYLYSNYSLKAKWEYLDKISEIAIKADDGLLEWVDIWINRDQKVSRNSDGVLIDNKLVKLFNRLSKDNYSKVGPVSAKIYNEFLRSRDKKDNLLRKFVKEAFDEGFFTKKITDIMEENYDYSIDETDLNNLDKQIIIRVKIEGYEFIINFIKNIINNIPSRADEYCQKFMSRVFLLESQNFIKIDTDKKIII